MLSYADLMAAKPEQFTAAARRLAPALTALTGAEKTFSTQVVNPLAAGRSWRGDAAGHAHTTARVHQHAMAVTGQELAATAKALALFGSDLTDLQQTMGRLASDAWSGGVVVHEDGSTHVQATATVAGEITTLDPTTVSGRQAAEAAFIRKRDALLTLAGEVDAGCAAILGKIAGAASDVVIDRDNTVPRISWNRDPAGLRKIELELDLPPEDGSGSTQTVEQAYAQLLTLMHAAGEGGNRIRQSIRNAEKALRDSPDPQVRAQAEQFLQKWSRFQSPDSVARLDAAALPVLTYLLNVAKYSQSSNSVVEVATKAGITTATATGSGIVLGEVSSTVFCVLANAPDDELGFGACEALASAVGIEGGSSAGEKLGGKLVELLYGDDGVPDPFVAEYKNES